MNPRSSIALACMFVCVGVLASSLPATAQINPKQQQARDLSAKASGEGSDRVKQVQDYCAAAQLDPTEKKYANTCSSYRSGLIEDDTAALAIAIAAYKSHDMDKAESQAKQVSSYDAKLSGQARFVLDLVRSQRLVGQVQAAWARGDFDAVTAQAQNITNADSKAAASAYVNNVNTYRGYIDQAQKAESGNPQEAIRLYTLARDLNANGPNNPAGRIAELQKAAQTRNAPPPSTLKPGTDSGDTAKKVGKLISDARNEEKQGNLQDALNDYGKALKLDPGNQEAQSGSDRIEQAIKNDPAAAKRELTSAIRYFYRSQFDDAERALREYLKSPQTAQNPGAAYFYLGAAMLEQAMLETPQANWRGPSADALAAFAEARKASYFPARSYVSPALLKVWDTIHP